jgi:glycosyltransferase involved in cell wall biosynthesis
MELVKTVNPLLPASKCRIIFNLVNFSRFQPSPAFRFRKDGKLSLLVAARIKQEKNMSGLIKALSLLSEEERNKIRVDWYGEYMQQSDPFNSLDESMRQIKTHGLEQVIRFHEAIHDVDRMIREADAVGLFSLFEGFPNVICEAMACQKPVICTRVSDISGFLAHEPGLLCNPFDPYSIKNALSCLIGLDNTQLEQIGTINRSIALERFNPDMIVTEYLQLMNNTIRAN